MSECSKCDAHVIERYRRVFSGNDGEIYGCPECMEFTEIINGEAVGRE